MKELKDWGIIILWIGIGVASVILYNRYKKPSSQRPYIPTEQELLEGEVKYNNSLYVKFQNGESDTAVISDSEIAIFSVCIDTLIKFDKDTIKTYGKEQER